MESKAISKHLKFIKYFSTAYSSTSLIAAAAATKAFQLLLKEEVAYANLTGKKDPGDTHLCCGPTHECLCDFFPQSLLIDILAMAQMEKLPLSLKNMISPFAFYIV